MADMKNYGLRFPDVIRPIYEKDNYPIAISNDLLGGFHIVRSLKEAEKDVQRLMIGMEVFNLEDGYKWRLVDAKITCNQKKIKCPWKSNKTCLFENPKCRISSFKDCKWRKVDLPPESVKQIVYWKEVLNIPWQLLWIAENKHLPNFYASNINIKHPTYVKPINLIADDGKIDKRLLRDNTSKENNQVEFYNPHIIVDHSFYPKEKWWGKDKGVPPELANIDNIYIDDEVQQVNLSLLTNLSSIAFGTNPKLNYLRIANSKIKVLDLRFSSVKDTLEDLILDDNPELEKICLNDVDSYDPAYRIPLKRFSCRNCPKLKEIYINGSQVNSVNLSTNTSVRVFSAINSQLVSVIAQSDYVGKLDTDDDGYIIAEETIHYFLKGSGMIERNFESMFHSTYPSTENYIISFHIGDDKYSKDCNYSIATNKGHIVILD